MSSRPPYSGKESRLIVAIDVGTTYSAASLCVLEPGVPPKFEEILRWPGQVNKGGKVPSIVYYDQAGEPQRFGADAERSQTQLVAEEQAWKLAKWFKLHLRPSYITKKIEDLSLSNIPTGKKAVDIFADYLRFVKEQLKRHIAATRGQKTGELLWLHLSPSMDLVLTTPNGWIVEQQDRMRTAAIRAGFADDAGAHSRVRFVSEAESAMLFAFENGCVGDWSIGSYVVLCDCGGGTIDISAYKIVRDNPLSLEESNSAQCFLDGSIFVTKALERWSRDRLGGYSWFTEEMLQEALIDFDQIEKHSFHDASQESVIPLRLLGHATYPELGISRGKLIIPGDIVAGWFDSRLEKIKEGLEAAVQYEPPTARHERLTNKVILVGGFANSPYVFEQLQIWGREVGLSILRPEVPLSNAVSNGALAWHLDNIVSLRRTRFHYGTHCHMPISSLNGVDLEERPSFRRADGEECIDGVWNCIVAKNTAAGVDQEFAAEFYTDFPNDDYADKIDRSSILACCHPIPPFFAMDKGRRHGVNKTRNDCTPKPDIEVDLRPLYRQAPVKRSPSGSAYRRVFYEICLFLGDTELKACFRWEKKTEKKKKRRVIGEAKVVCRHDL